MTQITIDLSDNVSHQIEESGISHEQFNRVINRLVELYFHQYQQALQYQVTSMPNHLPRRPRKAGSGKHLNIVMADDLLIAQSQVEQLPILSRDVTFDQYGVQRVWTL